MIRFKIKILLLLLFITILNSTRPVFSQDHGINWILGYGIKNDTSLYGRTILSFKNDSLILMRNSGGFKFTLGFENNSYSDNEGKLRFFYDGHRLGNAIDYTKIENGDTLNPGIFWQAFLGGFYPTSASVFLPPMELDSVLLLFHLPLDYFPNTPYSYSPHIYLTKINMNSNDGKGKVIFKNNSIFDMTLTPIVFSSCKHANGRDWWLICKNNQNSTYYTILIVKNEISNIDSQVIGNSQIDYSTVGNSVFSPNGKKFAKISNLDGIQVFEFDRCNGKLSNFIQIKNDSVKPAFWVNIAFSPNNRFLYASTNTQIFQYDLQAMDIQACMEIVGVWDGFIYDKSFTTSFCDLQLGPNGKIYLSCASGNIFLHVINNPNLKGSACHFQLRGITLPTYVACGLGNYPNYLLGPEIGSICDSLTYTREYGSSSFFNIYPNPSDGRLLIENLFTDYSKSLEIEIVDISGNIILRKDLISFQKNREFDCSFLNPGLYFIQFYRDHKLLQSMKWMVH